MSKSVENVVELKPCPFCGEAPRYAEGIPSMGLHEVIFCDGCDISIAFVENWNARATTALPKLCKVCGEKPCHPAFDHCNGDACTPF